MAGFNFACCAQPNSSCSHRCVNRPWGWLGAHPLPRSPQLANGTQPPVLLHFFGASFRQNNTSSTSGEERSNFLLDPLHMHHGVVKLQFSSTLIVCKSQWHVVPMLYSNSDFCLYLKPDSQDRSRKNTSWSTPEGQVVSKIREIYFQMTMIL